MPKAAKKAAAPDQPSRASCRVGARPTCRQRQYIDREGRRRRKNAVKSCSDAAARPGRSRPAPWKVDRDFTWPWAQCEAPTSLGGRGGGRERSISITIFSLSRITDPGHGNPRTHEAGTHPTDIADPRITTHKARMGAQGGGQRCTHIKTKAAQTTAQQYPTQAMNTRTMRAHRRPTSMAWR